MPHAYSLIEPKAAYSLQNAGGLVLICTRGADGKYDLAPVSWCCPLDYDPVSRFVCVLDTAHRTFADISATREFAIGLPSAEQKALCMDCGSISGAVVDKFARFGISAFRAKTLDLLLPKGLAGWIECRVTGILIQGTSGLVMGDAVYAEALPDWWKHRIHHVGEGLVFRPGETV